VQYIEHIFQAVILVKFIVVIGALAKNGSFVGELVFRLPITEAQ
jgi:hypothetical protein